MGTPPSLTGLTGPRGLTGFNYLTGLDCVPYLKSGIDEDAFTEGTIRLRGEERFAYGLKGEGANPV